jgi:hypothetical protein
MDDDLGPKAKKSTKGDFTLIDEVSIGEPNWDEFFAQLPE